MKIPSSLRTLFKPRPLLAAFLVASFAIFLRLLLPQADAPFDLSFSQSENTDWAWYLNRAFANVGAARWDATLGRSYDLPIFTAYATHYLQWFGASLATMTGFSLVPSLFIIGFLMIAMKQVRGKFSLPLLWLASINFILVMYSRIPTPYIWICAMGLAAIVLWQIRWQKPYLTFLGRCGTLGLILYFTIQFKSIAIIFAPALLIADALCGDNTTLAGRFRHFSTRTRIVLLSIGGALLIAGAAELNYLWAKDYLPFFQLFIGIDRFMRYGSEFSSPANIFENFHRLLRTNSHFIYRRMPIETAMTFLACCTMIWALREPKRILKTTDYYMVTLVLMGHIYALFLSYQPLRFFLFMIPAMIYLTVRQLDLIGNLPWFKQKIRPALRMLAAALLWINMSISSLLSYTLWAAHPAYTWKESREDIQQILPPHSIVGGCYAHFLTWGTDFQAYIAYLDDPNIFEDLQKHGVTHFAVQNVQGMPIINSHREFFKDWFVIDRLFIRGNEVKLFKIGSREPTNELEQGLRAANAAKRDIFLRRSERDFPLASVATRARLFFAFYDEKNTPRAALTPLLDEAYRRNPYHPLTQLIDLELNLKKYDWEAFYPRAYEILSLAPDSPDIRARIEYLLKKIGK